MTNKSSSNEKGFSRGFFISWIILTLLLLLAAFHVYISFTKGKELIDSTALKLLALAVLPVLIPVIRANFESFEIGSGGVRAQLRQLKKSVKEQEEVIEEQQTLINKLVIYSMAYYLFDMLREIYKCERNERDSFIYNKNDMEYHLRYLRDRGFLEHSFFLSQTEDGENLARKLKLTPIGRYYVKIREQEEAISK